MTEYVGKFIKPVPEETKLMILGGIVWHVVYPTGHMFVEYQPLPEGDQPPKDKLPSEHPDADPEL